MRHVQPSEYPVRVNYLQPGSIVVRSVETGVADDTALVATAPEADVEVSGRILRIDEHQGRLIVGGQTVQVDALSHAFQIDADGRRRTLAIRELAVGDRVEIAGPRNRHGHVLATRIERQLRLRPVARR